MNDSEVPVNQNISQISSSNDINAEAVTDQQVESDTESDFYPINVKLIDSDENITNNDENKNLANSLNDLSLQSLSNDNTIVNTCDNIVTPHTSDLLPKAKSKLVYYNPEALVSGRAGKISGKNKAWFNIKDLTENEHLCVDFNKIKKWRNANEDVLLANSNDNNTEILQAKQEKLQN